MIKTDECRDDGDLFIMAFDGEERSYYGWNTVCSNGATYKQLIVFLYDKEQFYAKKQLINQINSIEMHSYDIPNDQRDFVDLLIDIDTLKTNCKVTIDISCMKTPHLFLFMKYIKMMCINSTISVINTIPYDYIFGEQPFASYKTYMGDLELCEIIGFSGVDEMSIEEDLFIFLGFEGPMALKVVENTVFKTLHIVNTMPSYYQKYKDVSVVNNYGLLSSEGSRLSFVPAGNPFEVYNILDKMIEPDKPVCVAPLCTKPISLGICLYALDHENVRIVYPYSNLNNGIKSREVHLSYVYSVNV